MTNINVDIPDGMLADIEKILEKKDTHWATISEITRAALRDFFEKENANK